MKGCLSVIMSPFYSLKNILLSKIDHSVYYLIFVRLNFKELRKEDLFSDPLNFVHQENIIFGKVILFQTFFNKTIFKISHVFKFVKQLLKSICGQRLPFVKSFFYEKTDHDIILHPCLYLIHTENKQNLMRFLDFIRISPLKFYLLLIQCYLILRYLPKISNFEFPIDKFN